MLKLCQAQAVFWHYIRTKAESLYSEETTTRVEATSVEVEHELISPNEKLLQQYFYKQSDCHIN